MKGGEKKWATKNLRSWHKVLYGWRNVDRIVNRVGDLVIHRGQAAANGKVVNGDDAMINSIVANFLRRS